MKRMRVWGYRAGYPMFSVWFPCVWSWNLISMGTWFTLPSRLLSIWSLWSLFLMKARSPKASGSLAIHWSSARSAAANGLWIWTVMHQCIILEILTRELSVGQIFYNQNDLDCHDRDFLLPTREGIWWKANAWFLLSAYPKGWVHMFQVLLKNLDTRVYIWNNCFPFSFFVNCPS